MWIAYLRVEDANEEDELRTRTRTIRYDMTRWFADLPTYYELLEAVIWTYDDKWKEKAI